MIAFRGECCSRTPGALAATFADGRRASTQWPPGRIAARRTRTARTRALARSAAAGATTGEPRGANIDPKHRLPRLTTAGEAFGGRVEVQRSVVGDIVVATPFALDARVARRSGAPGVDRRAGDDLRGRRRAGLRSRARQFELAETPSGGGVEYQRAKLTANDGAFDDQFGKSVSIDGDTMVIGAQTDDEKDPRSAYVFTRDTTATSPPTGRCQAPRATACRSTATRW